MNARVAVVHLTVSHKMVFNYKETYWGSRYWGSRYWGSRLGFPLLGFPLLGFPLLSVFQIIACLFVPFLLTVVFSVPIRFTISYHYFNILNFS